MHCESHFLLSCRFVQILAEETNDSVCDLPSASPSVTPTTAQTHTSSDLIGIPIPTSSPSAAPPTSRTPLAPSTNNTVVVTSLQDRPAEPSGSLTLFVIGTLFLIVGASLAAIAIVVLLQQRKSCAQQAKKDIETGKDSESLGSKPVSSADLVAQLSPSPSVKSSDVEALQSGLKEEMPSESDKDTVQPNSPSQVNGRIRHSIHSSETANAVLGGVRCITPTSDHRSQIDQSINFLDEEHTHSSDA